MPRQWIETLRQNVTTLATGFRMYTGKAAAAAIVVTGIGLVAIGLPTAIYENPFFVRMTRVRAQDYIIWILSSALMGLIAGSYFVANSTTGDGKMLSGGLLSVVAVDYPTCNKLVVLLLGTTGALTFFAPLQLYIGIASVVLLGWTVFLRSKSLAGTCSVSKATLQ